MPRRTRIVPHPILTLGAGGRITSGPSTLIFDQFTDPDLTLLTAHTIAPINVPLTSWSFSGGSSWRILGNQAQCNVVGAGGRTCTCNAGDADITASLIINRNASTEPGVVVRFLDDSNHWWCRHNSAANRVEVQERNAGANVLRASAALVKAGVYTISVQTAAQTIAATVDAVTATYASASFLETETRHGMRVGATANNTMDDFRVEPS